MFNVSIKFKVLAFYKKCFIIPDCLNPPSSVGVLASFLATTHGSIVTYSCDYGHVTSAGDMTIFCDSGIWVGTPLTCSLAGKKYSLCRFCVRFIFCRPDINEVNYSTHSFKNTYRELPMFYLQAISKGTKPHTLT